MCDVYIKNRQQFRVSMFLGYLSSFQHNSVAKVLRKGKIREKAWERLRDTSNIIDGWLLGKLDKMETVKKRHSEMLQEHLHFIQFSFIGMFFLKPEEFYFNISDENDQIQFAKYWWKIMDNFGLKNNEAFMNGDLSLIKQNLLKQQTILISHIDNLEEEKELYLATMDSLNIKDRFIFRCFLCYYYEVNNIGENYWISFQHERYLLTKNLLFPYWGKMYSGLGVKNLNLDGHPLNLGTVFSFNILRRVKQVFMSIIMD